MYDKGYSVFLMYNNSFERFSFKTLVTDEDGGWSKIDLQPIFKQDIIIIVCTEF